MHSANQSRVEREPPKPVIKIQDICPGKELAPHIQHLMTLNGDLDFVSVHEWSARLCHALMVEAGFFPVSETFPLDQILPMDLLTMSNDLRIAEFVPKLDPNCMHSAQGIYAMKYKAIQAIEIESDYENTEASDNGDGQDKPHAQGQSEKSQDADHQPMKEWKYYFSGDINVTMLFTQDRLALTATYKPTPDDHLNRPVSHQFTINVEEFFLQKARVIPVELRPPQWVRKFQLNYTRFSGYFKSKFAMHLLDKMDAVVFERRGIISLPHLVLVKILKKSSIKTILSMGRSCAYLYDITRDNRLWKFLLKRDFPGENFDSYVTAVVSPPSTSSSSSATDPPPVVSETEKAEPDFYDIYKQKYLSKHRRLHRMHSFPLRIPIRFGVGRRMPSMPFHFQ